MNSQGDQSNRDENLAAQGRDDCPAFALFSGGHDSLCATHVAMTNGYAQEVVKWSALAVALAQIDLVELQRDVAIDGATP